MRQKVWKILSINAKYEINRNTLGSVWEKQTITYSKQVRMGLRLLDTKYLHFPKRITIFAKKLSNVQRRSK